MKKNNYIFCISLLLSIPSLYSMDAEDKTLNTTELLSQQDCNKKTLLHKVITWDLDHNKNNKDSWVVKRDQENCLRHLINLETDLNTQDATGKTALYYAVLHKKEEFVRQLLKAKANINIADKDGITPLMVACNSKNSGSYLMEYLLSDSTLDINAVDQKGESALIKACSTPDNTSLIKNLLNHNADITQVLKPIDIHYNTAPLLHKIMDVCIANAETLLEYLYNKEKKTDTIMGIIELSDTQQN